MSNAEMAKRLLAAAEHLRRVGHIKGRLGLPWDVDKGKMCAVGAINRAYTKDFFSWTYDLPECEEVAKTLGLRPGASKRPEDCWGTTLAEWNDLPKTTQNDVLLAFEQTAANLKAEAEVT